MQQGPDSPQRSFSKPTTRSDPTGFATKGQWPADVPKADDLPQRYRTWSAGTPVSADRYLRLPALPAPREFIGHEENKLLGEKFHLLEKWGFILTNVPFWVVGFALLSPWAPSHKHHTFGSGFCASNPEQSFWVFLSAIASTVFHTVQVRLLKDSRYCGCFGCIHHPTTGEMDENRFGFWIIVLLGADVLGAIVLCVSVLYCHRTLEFVWWFIGPMGLNCLSSLARGKIKRWTENPHERLCEPETLAKIYLWSHGAWHVSCGVALARFTLCSQGTHHFSCPA